MMSPARRRGISDSDGRARTCRAWPRGRHVCHPSVAQPWRDFALEQLPRDHELLTLELLRRARERGFAGSRSAFYRLLPQLASGG